MHEWEVENEVEWDGDEVWVIGCDDDDDDMV